MIAEKNRRERTGGREMKAVRIEKVQLRCERCPLPCGRSRAEIWVQVDPRRNLLVGRYTQADGREGIVGGTAETICALGADLRR